MSLTSARYNWTYSFLGRKANLDLQGMFGGHFVAVKMSAVLQLSAKQKC